MRCNHIYCMHCGKIVYFNPNLWHTPHFCSDFCSHRECEKVYGKTIFGEPVK